MAQADLLQQPPTAVSRARREGAEARQNLRDHLGIVLTSADRWFDAAAVALLILVAAVAALTFWDYGLGWDDYTHSEYGALLLRLYDSGFADRRALSFVNLYAYGGGFDMFAALAAKVLPFDLFETRRLCGALIGLVGLAITWRIGRRLGGPLAGLIGLALLATCPLYYGHMFMNAKDAPFAVAMAVMLLGLVRTLEEYPAPSATTATIFGLGLGLSMGTRVLGDFAPIYALAGLLFIVAQETKRLGAFALAKRDAFRFILTLLPALVLAYAVMALVWPWSAVSPLNPLRAVAYFSHFFEKPWKEMFAGVPVAVPDMPRTYVPSLFALTMPVILLVLGALGIAGGVLALTRRNMPAGWRAGILVTALAATVPILVALLTRPAMYNGIRHFVFVTPPLAVVGGLAGAWIISRFAAVSRLAGAAASAAIAFGLAVPTIDMIRLHPYEYTHFNILAGGVRAADDHYMLDYWGLAFKQAADELRAKLQEKSEVAPSNRRWRIAVCGPQRPAQVELGPDFVTSGDPAGADFAMMLGEFYCLKLNAPIVVEVERDGVIFARVYDIRGRSIRSLLTLPAPYVSPMLTFVFDAYGTLLDVHAAIARHRATAGPDAERLSEIWRIKQLEYSWTLTLAGQYVDFWTLTERALDFALARVPSVDKALKPQLLAAYQTLDAYPDARAILVELKSRGASTAILSNGTPVMLSSAIAAAKLEPVLDAVLSVDQLRIYKPRPEVYQLACDFFHVPPGEIIFISANRWDVMGAQTFGFRTVWINRTGAPDEYGEASRTVVSLAELARIDWAGR